VLSFKPLSMSENTILGILWLFDDANFDSVANGLLSLLASTFLTAASNGFFSWAGCWLPVAVVCAFDWRPPKPLAAEQAALTRVALPRAPLL